MKQYKKIVPKHLKDFNEFKNYTFYCSNIHSFIIFILFKTQISKSHEQKCIFEKIVFQYGVGLGREDYNLITRNSNREGVGTTWYQNWPQIRLNGLVGWLLAVKTKKKSFIFINIFFLKFRLKNIQQESNSNLELLQLRKS